MCPSSWLSCCCLRRPLLLGAISQRSALSIVIVVVLALLVKVALGDSFAMIAMVAAYHRSTRGSHLTRPWARIESISDKFGEIRDRPGRTPAFVPLPVASDPYVSE